MCGGLGGGCDIPGGGEIQRCYAETGRKGRIYPGNGKWESSRERD